MRSPFLALVLIVVVMVPVAGQTLQGVWKRVEVVIDSGADKGRHTSDVQPSLMIFTKRHYSVIFVSSFAPRPQLSDSAKDDERGRVFSPFFANAGTYQRGDSGITFTPIVAKVPAAMSGKPVTVRVRVKGDTLWFVGAQATWVRVERD